SIRQGGCRVAAARRQRPPGGCSTRTCGSLGRAGRSATRRLARGRDGEIETLEFRGLADACEPVRPGATLRRWATSERTGRQAKPRADVTNRAAATALNRPHLVIAPAVGRLFNRRMLVAGRPNGTASCGKRDIRKITTFARHICSRRWLQDGPPV